MQMRRSQSELVYCIVCQRMTGAAQSYQILFFIIASLTAELLMVNLEIRHIPTALAGPMVATQNSLSELFIGMGAQARSRLFGK